MIYSVATREDEQLNIHTLITGPTNGIGRATALALAKQGHQLILLCRNKALGEVLVGDIKLIDGALEPILLIADLGEPDTVREAVDQFLSMELPLHILINNAGVVNTERRTIQIDGQEQEQMFAVNHLGHYLLTHLLKDKLIESAEAKGKASRLVIVSSEAHALFCKGIAFDDMTATKYKAMQAYGRSKLANLLMMKSLVERVDASKLQINALHPGAVNSNLGGNNPSWYAPIIKAILSLFFISNEQGAQTTLYLATQPVDTQGEYYYKSKVYRMKPWALDKVAADKLWEYSNKILGLDLH